MIINLTWHDVIVKLKSWKKKTISSSWVIRLGVSTINLFDFDWIPITKTIFNSTSSSGIPVLENTVYIVSKIVCEAYNNRKDFYIVNGKWRSRNGRLYCTSLSPNPYYKWDT